MDIQTIRRNNTKRLIAAKFDNKQADFANAIDREANYISRLLSGGKPFGGKFARHIEKQLKLPINSLGQQGIDVLDTKLSVDEKALIDLYRSFQHQKKSIFSK